MVNGKFWLLGYVSKEENILGILSIREFFIILFIVILVSNVILFLFLVLVDIVIV